MKKILLLLLAAALAAGGYYLYRRGNAAPEAAGPEDRVVAKVARGDILVQVSASGRIEPERVVEIKSKASGEVKEVTADISDRVVQGQLLFRLDPADEERSVRRLRASLAMSRAKLEQVRLGVTGAEAKLAADRTRAEADLKFAEAEKEEFETRLNRAVELHQQRVITREELDSAKTRAVQAGTALANALVMLEDLKVQEYELDQKRHDVPIAMAQVENDEIALADAEQRLKETEVYSPLDGVVSERAIQEGVIVASGVSNIGGGTTAMRIIDLSRVYAIAAVDEADIRGVQPGVRATVTADAFPGVEFGGSVVRVATTGVVESNVVTFDVKIEVEGRGRRLLKPEMTTNVKLHIEERRGVLAVPVEAVARKAVETEGGADYSRRQSYVTTLQADGREADKNVVAGLSDGYLVEIVEGLAEGDAVAYRKGEGDSRWAGRNRPAIRIPRPR